MTLALISLALTVLSFGLAALILLHALRRSLGTLVMALCIPFYLLYYAFSQFEHRQKGLIVSGWLALSGLALILALGAALRAGA